MQATDKSSGLTQARLKELFHYDPESGHLRRILRTGKSRSFAGMNAGFKDGKYLRVNVDHNVYKRNFLVHRLIWLYMTGSWPQYQVDHIDGNPLNNKWENLRQATNGQNSLNRRLPKNNKTGIKGVTLNKKRNKYFVTISLGWYNTLEEAAAVRREAELRYYGNFRREVNESGTSKTRRIKPRLG